MFTLHKFVYFLQVTDSAWDPDRAPELETMLAVIKRNFTLGVLIEEWVGPDDRNSQNHIIQIGTYSYVSNSRSDLLLILGKLFLQNRLIMYRIIINF